MRISLRYLAAVILGILAAVLLRSFLTPPAPAATQGNPYSVTPLPTPTGRSAEGFTAIFDVAEMPDGRVLVTDNRERVLAIVDFERGSVTPIGREGEGPEEYRSVFTILPQPSGDFLIYDATLRRFLAVTGEGRVKGTSPMTRPALGSFSAPRGPDLEGYLYISHREVSPHGLLPEAILYRWSPRDGALERVATLSNYEPGQAGPSFVPMPMEDAWTFLPDGTVGRIVAHDYHLEWRSGLNPLVVGAPIPHPRIPVGEAERARWLQQLNAAPRGGRSRLEGSDETASREPSRPAVDPDRFPDFVPPFDGGYVPAAPWGEVWVRSSVLSDSVRTVFDVLNRQGNLARRVGVEGRARVVGFGPDGVYLARSDSLDLEWLERYGAG